MSDFCKDFMHLTYFHGQWVLDWSVLRIGLSLDVNDCMRCPGIMASLAFSGFSLVRVNFCNWRMIANLSENLWPKRGAIYSFGIFGIYLSLILLFKKKETDIYSSFSRIKSLRACWIVLQRWAWGRQRGVASSLILVPFSFPTSAPSWTNRLKISKRYLKKEKKKKR